MDHKPQFREAGVGDLLKIAQFNKDMALVSLLQCCMSIHMYQTT